MNTLCIVPCGNRKIWDKKPNEGSTRARDAYIGPFAKKCRQYAERFYPSSWCILSAKYGFLFPDDIIQGPYNVNFNDKGTNPITINELSNQLMENGLNNFDKIVVLGGKNYVNMIKAVFRIKNIYAPLSDCQGIGYMMGKLNEAIRRGVLL